MSEQLAAGELLWRRAQPQLTVLRPGQRDGVHVALPCRVPHVAAQRVVLCAPRSRLVDGGAVDVEPLAELRQSLLEDGHDTAVVRGTDVDQHVTAAADRLRHLPQELLDALHVLEAHLTPVAPGIVVQSEGVLPLALQQVAGVVVVATGEVTSVFAHGALTPAVVGHYRILHRGVVVEPGEELLGRPVLGCVVPVAIGPNHVRLVLQHQLVQLRDRLPADEVAPIRDAVVEVQRVEPFIQ